MRYTTTKVAILATCLMGLTLSTEATFAEPLSVARLFADPDLSGPRLREPKFSPDGRYVTYLQGKADNKDQLDLWAFDTRSGSARVLVDSRKLVGDNEKLSADEEAR